ncbi:hypothetical protein QJS10_CPB20g00923 [Acorus calamus]|uniref:Uncharacterized protein n=1 Tax=Acorus calamus TaxID=4465 RepID=A0AAV9C8M6_ACOCL|nr:hypothetical protein QJS10_CPB20g00923 [Acorus calamus]
MSLILNLLVDKKGNRVVCAEADSEFVDIIFSFLTLPITTIVRLLKKKSCVGCIDSLYQSMENLHPKHLQSRACTEMLLHPLSNSEKLYEGLAVKYDERELGNSYLCPKWACVRSKSLVSSVKHARCCCGEVMDRRVRVGKPLGSCGGGGEGDGAFVEGDSMFIVTDALRVMPDAAETFTSLVEELGIEAESDLEEMIVTISKEEVLKILKRALISESPLSDIFLLNLKLSIDEASDGKSKIDTHEKGKVETKSRVATKSNVKSHVKHIDLSHRSGSETLGWKLFDHMH